MPAVYNSKHGIVSRMPQELYMSFVDMRNFVRMLPADKQEGVRADFDTLTATVRGFTIGVRVTGRVPYSRITIEDNGAPFQFCITLHFDDAGEPGKTDFHIAASADLNLVMKAMLGNRIQQALDKIVDGLVDASEGRMPQGFSL